MSQQVKPGDLAVIVGGECSENWGVIVRVLHAERAEACLEIQDVTGKYRTFFPAYEPIFMVRSQGRPLIAYPQGHYFPKRAYRARFLRPLRDTDGEDEILRIAGKPEQFQHARFMPLGE